MVYHDHFVQDETCRSFGFEIGIGYVYIVVGRHVHRWYW
jgi:hypothetical protein